MPVYGRPPGISTNTWERRSTQPERTEQNTPTGSTYGT